MLTELEQFEYGGWVGDSGIFYKNAYGESAQTNQK